MKLCQHRGFPHIVRSALCNAACIVHRLARPVCNFGFGCILVHSQRILTARRCGGLTFAGLKTLGVVLKRAQYFLTCSGRMLEGLRVNSDGVLRHLAEQERSLLAQQAPQQLSLFDAAR